VQQANHHLLAARKDEATWPDRTVMLLAVPAWDAGLAGAGRESGPFVTGRLGRAFRSKCPSSQAGSEQLLRFAAERAAGRRCL
jgi:hypothetical protein